MKTVITTVGTSLLENPPKVKIPSPLYKATFEEWDSQKESIAEKQGEIKHKISNEPVDKLCAEVQTLLMIKKTYPNLATYLICTDTILSVMCADAIKPVLEKHGIRVYFEHTREYIVEGLIVEGEKASKTFSETGFPNLIRVVRNIESKSGAENRPILNVSGGYKALIPVMTIMGQLYDMEVNYVYEDGEELIKLPKVPMDFDFGLLEDVIPFIDNHYLSKDSNKTIQDFPNHIALLKKYNLIHGEVFPYDITFIGKLIKEYCENHSFYSQKSTLSHIVEYKIFEFFVGNQSLFGLNFPFTPKRSEKIIIGGREIGEIDILLRSGNSQDDDYGIVEVKSFAALLGRKRKNNGELVSSIEDIKAQLQNRQIKPISQIRNGKRPQKVVYIIYQMLGGMDENNKLLKTLVSQLKHTAEAEVGQSNFLAFLLTLSDFQRDNFYKNILELEVLPSHLKKINL